MDRMNAMVWTRYGPPDVFQLMDVEKPTPKDNEVLIRNHASTVTTGECELRAFRGLSVFWLPMRIYIGVLKPTRITILGQELAGEIEAVGKNVTRFREGDAVYAATGFHLRAHAEYTSLPEDGMVGLKPANMTFEEAASIPLGGLEAWQYLRRARIQKGQTVLVNGAGGSIGVIAVQLAKHFGADVTAVDRAEKLDMLRSIGADQVIDYMQQDFTRNGQTYDVVFDVIGTSSPAGSRSSLKPNGLYLSANPGMRQQLAGLFNLTSRRQWVETEYIGQRKEDLDFLRELIEAGKLKAVIDRRYPLEQMAEAHRYVETGLKKGSVVITLGQGNGT